MATANQNRRKCHKGPMRTRDKNKPPQARKNASDQAPISFSIAPDWLKGWHEFSRPITRRIKAKPRVN